MVFGQFNPFKKREATSTVDTAVLPASVLRSIVSNEDSMIGKEEMLRLVRDGIDTPTTFANAAFFMFLKASSSHPDLQKVALGEAVKRLKRTSRNDDEQARKIVRDIAEDFIRQLPSDQRTSGAKLKRLNLGGFGNWDETYAKVASRLSQDPRDVFIVGHSMLIALSSFVRTFRDVGRSFHIIIPQNLPENGDLLDPKSNYPVGYTIEPDGSVVSLGKYFARPANAVVVDDIRNEGKTEERIRRYWTDRGTEPPAFEPLETINGNKLAEAKRVIASAISVN